LLAGGICLLAIGIKRHFRFDDALDVVAVHLVGGITGSRCSDSSRTSGSIHSEPTACSTVAAPSFSGTRSLS
jgi:Amt family ammonium transporter